MHKYNDILKELRETEKISQTKLGQEFNLTQRQISTYETGRNEPPYEILIKYAKRYNVSTDYILGLTKDPTPNWTNKKVLPPMKSNNIENILNNNTGNIGDISINQS